MEVKVKITLNVTVDLGHITDAIKAGLDGAVDSVGDLYVDESTYTVVGVEVGDVEFNVTGGFAKTNVTVEVEKESGVFVSKDDLADELVGYVSSDMELGSVDFEVEY